MNTAKIPRRKDVARAHQWDLRPLFVNDDEWQERFRSVQESVPGYDQFRGRLHESVDMFLAGLEFHLSLARQFEKVYTFSHLKNDEDKSNGVYQAMHQKSIALQAQIAEASSFINPEIQALPLTTLNGFMADERMDPYRFFIEKIVRMRPHTLGQPEEQILALSQEMARAPADIFGQLDNVDLSFGSITNEAGQTVELSHGNFITFLMSSDREIRKKAFHQYYQSYDAHRYTLAAAMTASAKRDHFYAKVRGFDSCRKAALFGDNIPEGVYDNLIDTVKHHLGGLYRYFRLRQHRLGISPLQIYDTYVPLITQVPFKATYASAVEMCCDALQPLGDEYVRVLRKGLLEGWVDRYENRGKRSGAYSSGCYDSPPYILLNFEDNNINSVYTLIHEAGHSMHSYYAIQHQPYVNYDYPIFLAEVASTVNECLLSRHLLERYADNNTMKAYIINREIDNLRGTFFRQTMFAEFERITHRFVEEGTPLTLDLIREKYRQLLNLYFGDRVELDSLLELECLRIPHFYSAFYVYKYATGISAAIALADKILTEGQKAAANYLGFLKLGGSRFPLDALAEAGIAMDQPEPVIQAAALFDQRVQQLETLLDTLA